MPWKYAQTRMIDVDGVQFAYRELGPQRLTTRSSQPGTEGANR